MHTEHPAALKVLANQLFREDTGWIDDFIEQLHPSVLWHGTLDEVGETSPVFQLIRLLQ